MQVTRHGGFVPLDAPDGQTLFYGKPDNTIWGMSLPGGEARPVFYAGSRASGSAYAPGRKGIYFIREASPGGKQSLAFLHLANGQITTLAEISRPLELGFALSPDERTILYSQIDHVSSELMLVSTPTEKFSRAVENEFIVAGHRPVVKTMCSGPIRGGQLLGQYSGIQFPVEIMP